MLGGLILLGVGLASWLVGLNLSLLVLAGVGLAVLLAPALVLCSGAGGLGFVSALLPLLAESLALLVEVVGGVIVALVELVAALFSGLG